MQDTACERLYGKESRDKQDISEEFMKTPEYTMMLQKEEVMNRLRNLFAGKVFYLNRETPTYSLEFLIPAFGGEFGYEGENSPYGVDDKEVTHHVMDRNADPSKIQFSKNRDFIVPQWVYDCINHSILLPASQYKPGSPPPPHLSPFIDNKAEGYMPKRQEEINEMKGVVEEVYVPEVDEESDPDVDMKPDHPQEQGTKADKYDDDSSSDSEDEEQDNKKTVKQRQAKTKLKESLEKERKELGKLLMTKKQRRLYTRINYSQRRKREFIQNLKDKRSKLEQGDD